MRRPLLTPKSSQCSIAFGNSFVDVVTYASVRSFLYGQADNTLAQNESLGFNYVTFAAARNLPVNQADLSRRVSVPARGCTPVDYDLLLGDDSRH